MALGPRLDLRQSATLVMTPQLQQAIKLLQMSNLELGTYIEQQLESNPLLELEDPDGGFERGEGESDDPPAADADAAGDRDFEDAPETPDSLDRTNAETLPDQDTAPLDTEYDNLWDGDLGAGAGRWDAPDGGRRTGEDDYDFDNVAAKDVTLREYLLRQVNEIKGLDPVDRMIAGHLIERLDDAGYLVGGVAEVAQAMGCEAARVEKTLAILKRFDPPGIFAADLAECLALQLADKNRLDPAMEALLENLDLLAKRDFAALRRLCGVNSEDLADMVGEIKALNPKPADPFTHTVAQAVTPDVLLRRGGGGEWIVELNSDTLPRVLVNSRYYAVLRKSARKAEDKEFLIDCFQSANWLVRSLQQRAETILKVATELVAQQQAFFHHGVQFLKPLTLRDVAEVVGVHESTVSRVTNNKYLAMSRGVFEMKYFFTSAVGHSGSGDSHSAESIRFRIKNLIEEEDVDAVLSDDKIVEILRGDGVDIARRTVAKYRESMRIPSSVRRRREKDLLY